MSIPPKIRHAILATVAVIVGALAVDAMHETCGEWKDRYVDALQHGIAWTPGVSMRTERLAIAAVLAERPVGCR